MILPTPLSWVDYCSYVMLDNVLSAEDPTRYPPNKKDKGGVSCAEGFDVEPRVRRNGHIAGETRLLVHFYVPQLRGGV